MKAVLISIRPEWCVKIANGLKTVEVRKTRPKLAPPFRCYIYCTKGRPQFTQSAFCEEVSNGKVVGEFVCAKLERYVQIGSGGLSNPQYMYSDENYYLHPLPLEQMCMDYQCFEEYAGGKECYGWHISDLVIYDIPKPLSEFYQICDEWEKDGFTPMCRRCYNYERSDADMCYVCCVEGELSVERPPQSWRYVEEI